MTFAHHQPHPSEFIRHRPLLPKSMTEAQLATLADLKVLITNIDRSLENKTLDNLDRVHMKNWRAELVSQVEDLETKLNGVLIQHRPIL